MTAALASTMSPRGAQLLGAMRRNLELLVELEKSAPADVMLIVDALVAHLKSWKPMAASPVALLLDTGPTPRIDAGDLDAEHASTKGVTIPIENGRIELYRLDGEQGPRLELYVHENTGHDASGVLTADQSKQLLGEIPRVLATFGAG